MGESFLSNKTAGMMEFLDLLEKAHIPHEVRTYETGVVAAIPSFEEGRIVSAIQTHYRERETNVRLCVVREPQKDGVYTPREAVDTVKELVDDAERRRRVYR